MIWSKLHKFFTSKKTIPFLKVITLFTHSFINLIITHYSWIVRLSIAFIFILLKNYCLKGATLLLVRNANPLKDLYLRFWTLPTTRILLRSPRRHQNMVVKLRERLTHSQRFHIQTLLKES